MLDCVVLGDVCEGMREGRYVPVISIETMTVMPAAPRPAITLPAMTCHIVCPIPLLILVIPLPILGKLTQSHLVLLRRCKGMGGGKDIPNHASHSEQHVTNQQHALPLIDITQLPSDRLYSTSS